MQNAVEFECLRDVEEFGTDFVDVICENIIQTWLIIFGLRSEIK